MKRNSGRENAQPHRSVGVVDIEIDQADALPCAVEREAWRSMLRRLLQTRQASWKSASTRALSVPDFAS